MTRRQNPRRTVDSRMVKCDRCRRRYRGHGDWNFTWQDGGIVGYLCPDCQTPQENAEALIREATLVYGRDQYGRVTAWPKIT